jgi:hypothetical protein
MEEMKRRGLGERGLYMDKPSIVTLKEIERREKTEVV